MIRGALRRTLTAAVRGALREPHVRRIAERELALSRTWGSPRPTVSALPSRRVRRSSTGTASHTSLTWPCVIGSPSWRVMTDPDKVGVPPSDDDLRARAQKAETNVREAVSLVSAAPGSSSAAASSRSAATTERRRSSSRSASARTSSAPTSRATTSCNALPTVRRGSRTPAGRPGRAPGASARRRRRRARQGEVRGGRHHRDRA